MNSRAFVRGVTQQPHLWDLAADGTTMVVLTHEMQFALEVADRVAMMDKGALVEIGPAEDILRHAREAPTQAFLRCLRGE